MEQNLITDKRLRAVCRYAEHMGLAYYSTFNESNFKVLQYAIRRSFHTFNKRVYYSYRNIKRLKAGIKRFHDSNINNKHIEKLGINVEIEDGVLFCNLLLSYKVPNASEIDIFFQSIQAELDEKRWDSSIEDSAENIYCFDITVKYENGQVKQFCNPLNTAIHGFYRDYQTVDFYYNPYYGILFKAIRTHPDYAFYVRRKTMGNGHSIVTIFAKPLKES